MPLTDYQEDAFAYLRELLESYGLESLSQFALDQVINGTSATQFRQMLWERPEFRQRFKVIFDRQAKGLAAMTPQEVIEFETRARQTLRAAGLPPSFYDSQDDFYNFMVNDVSLTELTDRIKLAETAAYNLDPVTRAELDRLWGTSPGDLTAYFLDPNRALPILQQRLLASQVAGGAVRAGYAGQQAGGMLTREEAERLASLGITGEQAAKGFGEIVTGQELYNPLPGEIYGEAFPKEIVSRTEQFSAVFEGNAAVQERIRRRRANRAAAFRSGGSFTTDQVGFGGLGAGTT
jgi:hypothetical protein